MNPKTSRRGRHGAASLAVLLALAGLLPLNALLPTRAAAQAIRGVALEQREGWPLSAAMLLLMDTAGTVVDSATTGPAGEYRLRAPGPGWYTVHVQLDGWAGVPSESFEVAAGADRELELRIPLIGGEAMRHMSSVLADEQLQRPLDEICGEALRPWEAGVLLGVVRERGSRSPVAGVRVVAHAADGRVIRTTVSNQRGNYVLCNLPAGESILVVAEDGAGDGAARRGTTDPEIQAGMAAWYDIMIAPIR